MGLRLESGRGTRPRGVVLLRAYARATANVAVPGRRLRRELAGPRGRLRRRRADQALELDPAHAPSTRLRGRLLPPARRGACPRRIRGELPARVTQ